MNDLSEDAFRVIVEDAWEHVPDTFKTRVDNVALLIEEEPDEETRTKEKLGPHETLLGLYHGIPESERGQSYGVSMTLPDTITLYRLPIFEEADAFMHEKKFDSLEDAVKEAVRETLWHELGHYFGLHEEEVRTRERQRSNRYNAH